MARPTATTEPTATAANPETPSVPSASPVKGPNKSLFRHPAATAVLFLFGAIALAVTAQNLTPATEIGPDGAERIVHYGWMSALPAIVAIALAFTTRQVLLALMVGIATGGLVYGFGSGVAATDIGSFPWLRLNFLQSFILARLATPGFAVILFVYLWSLGGLIGLWSRTGAALHFAQTIGDRFVVGPRSAKMFTWIIGLVFHQGGTISTVLAGTTARPLLDKHGIAKEEQAYLVDSTASPVATVLPFNAFPIVAATAIVATIPLFAQGSANQQLADATSFYFRALPFNFYSIFAVLLTLLFALHLMPAIGPMRRARLRAHSTGELVRPGADPLMSKELEDIQPYPGYRPGLIDFVMPLTFLLVIAIGPFLIQGFLGNTQRVYVAEAFFASVLVAAITASAKGMPTKAIIEAIVDGAKGVTVGAIIIGLAVAMGGVANALGTGDYVASLIGDIPAYFLPPLLLLAAMFTAFSTGTSFGTFGVLLPVAMPLAHAILPGNETFLAMSMAAVIGGSTFGDQCSPISDTTILSSLATGSDLMDHVVTQLPYALMAASAAALLYIGIGVFVF